MDNVELKKNHSTNVYVKWWNCDRERPRKLRTETMTLTAVKRTKFNNSTKIHSSVN